jgi:predicted lipoprotein
VADQVAVPAYEQLVATLDEVTAALDHLCAAPSRAALDEARAAWAEASLAWRETQAVRMGPATDRRLAASIGFLARPEAIADLLEGDDDLDPARLDAAGAAVTGLSALELALFEDAATELATTDGARRCQYAASVSELARRRSAEVLADWTDGYDEELATGLDGDSTMSVNALVNELIFRATEVDDLGLRALVEVDDADDLADNRADGPARVRLAELRATLTGVTAVIGEPGQLGLLDLVEARSPATADRLQAANKAAARAIAELPDSVTEAMGEPAALAEAQARVMDLKVLLSTEVASQLGVTVGFGDADGDS